MASRRGFLRDAAAVTVVGALSGCFDGLPGASDTDVSAPGDGRTDGEPTADDERVVAHERAIHERTNGVRERHAVDPLAYNEAIAAVAREHSADMARRSYFSHESPEGEGPDDRLADFFPGHCRGIGENLASVGRHPDDDPEAVASRIVSGWMNSPGHRENVLQEAFDEEGIGVVITGTNRVLATQNFCATSRFLG